MIRDQNAAASANTVDLPGPHHLVVCVNGLFSCAKHWDTSKAILQERLGSTVLVHPSQANERFDTYRGIDECGLRLADEIRGVVAKHSSLEEITFIGHSLGGLIARYAIGDLYDGGSSAITGSSNNNSASGSNQDGNSSSSSSGTMLGGRLRPMHFIAIASPHCGIMSDIGLAQVCVFVCWCLCFAPLRNKPMVDEACKMELADVGQ